MMAMTTSSSMSVKPFERSVGPRKSRKERPKIAQRFNAGFTSQNGVESRRDGRDCLPHRRDFFRPSGACSRCPGLPTVETVGYFHPPLPGLDLGDRILSAKQKNPAADTSGLEREIDQQVYALYALTPEEIKIVEDSAK